MGDDMIQGKASVLSQGKSRLSGKGPYHLNQSQIVQLMDVSVRNRRVATQLEMGTQLLRTLLDREALPLTVKEELEVEELVGEVRRIGDKSAEEAESQLLGMEAVQMVEAKELDVADLKGIPIQGV